MLNLRGVIFSNSMGQLNSNWKNGGCRKGTVYLLENFRIEINTGLPEIKFHNSLRFDLRGVLL